MKHYDPADIANIKLLIMSEDSANVYIGVKLAKNVLGMNVKELKDLILISDVTESINKWGRKDGLEIKAFGTKFYGKTPYSTWNQYRIYVEPHINKLIYDLD